MQLKKCLLTSLLFAPLWIGSEVFPIHETHVKENVSLIVEPGSLRIQEQTIEVSISYKLNIIFLIILSILFLSVSLCSHKKLEVIKTVRFIKNIFCQRKLIKSKKNHYYHFYCILDRA